MTNLVVVNQSVDKETFYKMLGKNIKYFREKSGKTQKHLAIQLNITHQQVHKYENGISAIAVDMLLNICNCLEVNVNDLILKDAQKIPEKIRKAVREEVKNYIQD